MNLNILIDSSVFQTRLGLRCKSERGIVSSGRDFMVGGRQERGHFSIVVSTVLELWKKHLALRRQQSSWGEGGGRSVRNEHQVGLRL